MRTDNLIKENETLTRKLQEIQADQKYQTENYIKEIADLKDKLKNVTNAFSDAANNNEKMQKELKMKDVRINELIDQ